MQASPVPPSRESRLSVPAGGTAVLLALGLAALLTRLPFVRPTPVNWDSVQFALALDRFDLHDHQPHPPGYILYVWMGRAIRSLLEATGTMGGDAGLGLALLSVLFGAAAVPLIYRLALA